MISKIFLDSDAPDHIKLSIRGLDKAVDVKVALDELVEKYLSKMDGRMANAETLETVLSYLELVEAGIKQFTQDTPFVEHVSEVTDDE